MKKILVLVILLKLLLIFPIASYADSPITATKFYEAYLDVKMVERAHLEGVMGLEIAEFLTSPENSIDVKAAVINALSWKFDGKSNAELYAYYLALLYHVSVTELDTEFLSADEIFYIGYLTAMDDYFHPEKALPLLEEAHKMMKDSFTVSIILALARGQKVMDYDWCEVWRLTEEVLKIKSLNRIYALRRMKMIVDYMVLYKEYCE